LGEGGFGKVVLGQHKVTQEKVAIKFVNINKLSNKKYFFITFKSNLFFYYYVI